MLKVRSAGDDAWLGGPAPAVPHLDAPGDSPETKLSLLDTRQIFGKELASGSEKALTKSMHQPGILKHQRLLNLTAIAACGLLPAFC